MMTQHQFHLTKIQEECAEVAQRAAKQAQFGDDQRQTSLHPTNWDRTWEEFLDLLAAMEMAGFPIRDLDHADWAAIERKKQRVAERLKESQQLGMVEAAPSV